MKSTLLGLLAETAIHPGSSHVEGAIDLPVAREAATNYPFVAGSSLKGALRMSATERSTKEDVDRIFGVQDNAGGLLVSDARLLLLPVRSLSGTYRWATCKHLIERLLRDQKRSAGGQEPSLDIPDLADRHVRASNGGRLFLEERSFTVEGEVPEGLVELLTKLIPHDNTRDRLKKQLVLLSDADFSWFARYGLAVQARNVLDNEKKTSQNLWYEETLPADTLMYALLAERQEGRVAKAKEILSDPPYVQVGGNETIGQGWFALSWLDGQS